MSDPQNQWCSADRRTKTEGRLVDESPGRDQLIGNPEESTHEWSRRLGRQPSVDWLLLADRLQRLSEVFSRLEPPFELSKY